LTSAEIPGRTQKDTDQLKKWSENTSCNSVKTSIKISAWLRATSKSRMETKWKLQKRAQGERMGGEY